MTARTGRGHVRAGQRECRVVVIEGCRNPSCRVVAYVASLRKTRGSMIGVIGAVVILHVAGRTTSAGEVVVPVDVTLRA